MEAKAIRAGWVKMKIRDEVRLEPSDIAQLKKMPAFLRAHSMRVGVYARMLAVKARYAKTQEDADFVYRAAIFHDVGKDTVSSGLYMKEGPLSEQEWNAIRQHVLIGTGVISGMRDKQKDKHFWDMAADACRYHHEKWDGSGYLCGLKGETIPLIARIVALADSFDAMLDDRCYSPKVLCKDAFAEIRRCSGTQFDPFLAEIFCSMENQLVELQDRCDMMKNRKIYREEKPE